MVGVVGGNAWQGGMHGGECIAWGHLWQESVDGRGDGHCSGQYASYWNAFLLKVYELIDVNNSCAF